MGYAIFNEINTNIMGMVLWVHTVFQPTSDKIRSLCWKSLLDDKKIVWF